MLNYPEYLPLVKKFIKIFPIRNSLQKRFKSTETRMDITIEAVNKYKTKFTLSKFPIVQFNDKIDWDKNYSNWTIYIWVLKIIIYSLINGCFCICSFIILKKNLNKWISKQLTNISYKINYETIQFEIAYFSAKNPHTCRSMQT